ncbi:MAG: NHLP bacteriocin export ABC transporter permease/ATPase subunit [Selenomonadaceae bacterium]|nr:NHLP bacteriocin export ABC transporter permease/ATPase subunit [Selenomonadaceae bacterium]
MELLAGQRFTLDGEDKYLVVERGAVEVYAVTSGDASFRQSYLMPVRAGSGIFPSMDDLSEIKILIYATEDSELTMHEFSMGDVGTLKPLMSRWFFGLEKISWLQLLTDKGDETLLAWRRGTVFDGITDLDGLMLTFVDNEVILSMFLGVRFNSEDTRLTRRTRLRQRNKRTMIENSIRSLLGEDQLLTDGGERDTNAVTEDATYIVRRVAKRLNMPTENISIRAEVAATLDQVSIIRRLIRKGNMQIRLVDLPSDWHKFDTGVLIGFYGEEKKLAALLPETPEQYRMVTTDYPRGRLVDDELASRISKDAFMCYGGFPARALTVLDLLRFMFKQCWLADYKTILATSLIAGLVPLATPLITETIFEDIIPILDRQGLATVTQALMITSFTTAALAIVRSIAVMRISTRIEISAEAALWNRLLTLPTKFFRRYTVGELTSRMSGLGVVKGLISGDFVGSIFGFVFSFWSVLLMCYYSLKLTLAALCVWAVYSIFIFFVYRRVIEFNRKMIECENRTAGTVQQIFAGLSKFRVQGAEEQAYQLWARDFGEQWNWGLKLRWQNNYTSIIASIQPFVLTMILYYVAVYGMNEVGPNGQTVQGIGYAQFMAFSAAYSSFNGVLGGVVGLIGQFFGIQPHLENLKPILEEEPEAISDKADATVLSGVMEVSHLTFAYEGSDHDVLRDVSFKIAAGENVAIVGKSGCGKSTLVRLLLGFETPKSGSIYYDGQDLSELSLPSVRTQMGVVLQNGQLMSGDIFSNIVGTRLLTQDDAWEAAEAAGIANDIAMMPMGMQTVISEGSSNISGGQRQRILIARALVNKPSILIFDEATSALDNRAQAIVTSSIERLKATRLVIAHRLSTIRNCDRVIVMDDGKVAETGTFDELMERGGIFAELVKRQVA